ncbi:MULTISPECIES: FABP family protein [Gordonia]|uniref:Ferric nitrobindin-like protein n=2 Tax=Gordonia TaxID=2053 RepID=L7LGY2_9ACTN|nr:MULTISPECIES: FABP family protein [Gordonia]AUH68089.1 FABP family protein [Gordonia sp. YC-JH1]KJR07756.1 fatty acid-binding protein [Gordonia sihwensis]MBY4569261.1 FABP family protein [Gordonia sihwensis]WFN92172.1 FABP family protein [Gordonia sihwensis]GAC60370.1 putative fatty acid-binding protein-like protein [Gordonia sihwensis NBRC 108236]
MTRSGNEAISDAEQRAQQTAGKNLTPVGDLPVPPDTANLREGPDLHSGLLALLPMVGVWEGQGEGHDPVTGDDYQFGQQIIVSHDGGNYLVWQARSWVIDDDGAYVRPDLRESGFWRISEDDEIELLLTHAEGSIELYYGRPLTQTSWNLTTDVTIRSETGSHTGGAKRLFGLVPDGDLAYVEERVDAEGELTPRLSAKLRRVVG